MDDTLRRLLDLAWKTVPARDANFAISRAPDLVRQSGCRGNTNERRFVRRDECNIARNVSLPSLRPQPLIESRVR